MTSKSLSHPSQLDPEVQASVRSELASLVENVSKAKGFSRLRLRDWDFLHRDGQVVCDVVLDKGHSWLQYEDFTDRPEREHNLEVVNIQECVAVHKALLENPNIFERFDDCVHFEIGSSGEEPPLRSQDDFEMAIGLFVRIEQWTRTSKQGIKRGRLLRVDALPNGGGFRIEIEAPAALSESEQNSDQVPILIESPSIKRAALLLFDPGNFANK